MRRLVALAGFVIAIGAGVFALSTPIPAEAKSACLCQCKQDPVVITKSPAGSSAAECADIVCPRTDVCNGSDNVAGSSYTGGRCSCRCNSYTPTATFTALSPDRADCRGDCTQACDGQENLITDGRVVDVSCIPGSTDCRVGAYSVYEGVSCVLANAGAQATSWPETNGQKPVCFIPQTLKNANIECSQYGGIAKGGTCGAIGSGERPDSYYKSRPRLGSTGIDYTGSYTYTQWVQLMDSEHPNNDIPADAGICYRFGVTNGSEDFELNGSVGGVFDVGTGSFDQTSGSGIAAIGDGSNAFVCLKKKGNLCGTVMPLTTMSGSGSARSYSCQTATSFAANNSGESPINSAKCFPTAGSVAQATAVGGNCANDNDCNFGATRTDCAKASPSFPDLCMRCDASIGKCVPRTQKTVNFGDLCVTQPNTYCCLGGSSISGCLTDNDCSLDRSKICTGANLATLTYGRCVFNTTCDYGEPDRKCRVAAATERVNSSICSPETSILSGQRRCPISGQTCCKPQNQRAISSCASDLAMNPFASGAYIDFACLPISELNATEVITLPDGQKQVVGIDPYNQEGYVPSGSRNCLTTNIQQTDVNGNVTGSVPRCSSGQFCCNAVQIRSLGGAATYAAQQAGRVAPPGSCGTDETKAAGFRCVAYSAVLPGDDAEAQEHGYATVDAYLTALTQSPGCRVTPFPGEGLRANLECTAGNICCDLSLTNLSVCTDDHSCYGTNAALEADCSQPAPNNPERCLKCDPTLKQCVQATLMGQMLGSESCFLRAKAEGEGSAADQIMNLNNASPDQFSCQVVASDTPGIDTKCLNLGCSEPYGAAGGTQFRCCVPGVGQTAAAGAQTVRLPPPPSAPFGLRLPACIASGNCSLDDVVFAGAQFANFLIQISGAVFLAIFVYAGFRYLTAATSDRAARAKKTIIQATFALALLMGGFVFISFIQSSLVGGATGNTVNTCGLDEQTKPTSQASYACTWLRAGENDEKAISEEVTQRKCFRNKCPGPKNYVCCPQ